MRHSKSDFLTDDRWPAVNRKFAQRDSHKFLYKANASDFDKTVKLD